MLSDPLASLIRSPSPTSTVECGPTSTPDLGCSDETSDALAAYAMSLAWYISRKQQYASKAIAYLNAWARTLKAHTNSNAKLQTAWAGATWVRAAEIMRYSGSGWKVEEVGAFEKLLRDVYLPLVIQGSNFAGNWELGPWATTSAFMLGHYPPKTPPIHSAR